LPVLSTVRLLLLLLLLLLLVEMTTYEEQVMKKRRRKEGRKKEKTREIPELTETMSSGHVFTRVTLLCFCESGFILLCLFTLLLFKRKKEEKG
jgi:hypothetical protein